MAANLGKIQKQQLQKHHESFQSYLAGDWKTAKNSFTRLYEETKDPLYYLYLKRIKENAGKVPLDWDGIYTHMTK